MTIPQLLLQHFGIRSIESIFVFELTNTVKYCIQIFMIDHELRFACQDLLEVEQSSTIDPMCERVHVVICLGEDMFHDSYYDCKEDEFSEIDAATRLSLL